MRAPCDRGRAAGIVRPKAAVRRRGASGGSVLGVLGLLVLGVLGRLDAAAAGPRHEVLVVVGAAGAPEFAPRFAAAAGLWRDACASAGASCTIIGLEEDGAVRPQSGSSADRDAVAQWFSARDPAATRPVWFVYLGHGTWDGREARLNLRGADLTGTEMKQLLAGLGDRLCIVIDGGSASGPFTTLLAGPRRVIVTATSSGDEVNYARFGERFAVAIAGAPDAVGDLDMDGQTSVLEAFVAASREVELFYANEGRMATEHALVEDNGDGRGTPAEFFRGTRVVRAASDAASPDGEYARTLALRESPAERMLTDEQRKRRDALERELEELRRRKDSLAESEYLRALEEVLRRLAALYREDAEDS